MPNLIKFSIILIIFGFLISGGVILAQKVTPDQEVTQMISQDEDIQPEDLDIGEPKILPDSPFYFLKNWTRAVQSFLTFNPVKRAELKTKIANEKLIEIKKMIEENKNSEDIKEATESYKKEVEGVKVATEKIKETAAENEEVNKFLDKFTHQQILHQKLLDKLETQVSPEAFEKIQEAREEHLERFKDVMLKLEDRAEVITEKLDKILEKQKGSQFKEFKNLEVLKNLEEKVPEEAKEAIQRAQENALKRLQGDLEKMSPEDQEKFKEYIEKISGDKEKQLEILENLKSEIKALPETPKILELKEKLEESKTKVLEKIEEKLEKLDCPLWTPPAPDFCKEGRIVVEKDPETGCPLPPKCVIPGEVEIPEKPEKPEIVCITLWDPVCGKNGKTYSNKCFAEVAGVEVAYESECKEEECQTDADCPQLKCTIVEKCIGIVSRCIEGKCILVENETNKKEKSCINSGGKLSTSLCCESVSNFPNTCLIGPCGCAPKNSHQVKICDCGEAKCFNGEKCIPLNF